MRAMEGRSAREAGRRGEGVGDIPMGVERRRVGWGR